ncbi:protease modulator HflC [Dongshaea marina]|uniref:protease modulator HflC n=1 Tax=Dongshaea marina TaxID=2047966 RepID=UPI000D3E710C|nr:protease modulator HflC [Dongshaea marina]
MKKFIGIIIVIVLVLVYSSMFVVREGQRGILTRFSKIERDSAGKAVVFEPGLHFKIPVVESVIKLDARVQTLDGNADRFVTSEKKDLIIDSYVKWRISDFAKYYLATNGDRARAESLLKRKINNGLRSEIGSRTIKEIVSGQRGELMEDALKRTARSSELGIKVIDVRIKQINLPTEVSNSIYQRMRAERNAVAKEHRSEGQEQAEIIRATIDRKVTVMIADANRKASQIKGEGDAQAAKIYANAYKQDPEFFSFLRSLQAYQHSFSSGDNMMVLSPDDSFFKYFNDSKGSKK